MERYFMGYNLKIHVCNFSNFEPALRYALAQNDGKFKLHAYSAATTNKLF